MEDIKVDLKNMKVPKISKKKITTFILILGIIVLIFTGLYTVNPEEVGVIQRFGKYVETTEPGLHFKIPFGVDKLTKVKVKSIFKEEFGFRTLVSGIKSQYSKSSYTKESLMLTGDLNIADVQWIVQFKVKDPYKFLFKVRNVNETIRNLSESTMRMIVGNRSVDEVIVLDRKEIAFKAKKNLQTLLDKYNTGIEIVTIKLQNVNPPVAVQPAFNDVNSAKQEQERIINNAWEKYNKNIPEAEGKAKQTIEQAQGYAISRVNSAQGDVQKFVQVWKQYRNAKKVTKRRMYLETMQEILPKLDKVYIVDDKVKGILPLLNLNTGGK